MSPTLSRARGALWGQAVGDALGTTVEFQSAAEVARGGPPGWPTDIVGLGPFGMAPGQVTDDTELALALARSLAARGTWDADDVAAAYVAWRASGPRDCGKATDQAFGRGVAPGPGLAERVMARASRNTQANGSLMRSSPLGIFGAHLPREALAQLAARDSQLSHPHEVCQAACTVFVTTVADAIRTGAPGPELAARALAFAKYHPLAAPVVDTLEAAAHGLPPSDGEDQGWVRVALQHAFHHLEHATRFDDALIATIARGGDTDTNAAIVGALLGAVMGVEALPARWIRTVRECTPERPRHFHCNDLDELAQALLRV
jgi:ADP-ribosylglycohydrolase